MRSHLGEQEGGGTLCLYAAAVCRSVSLAAGRREELLSVVVPLADQETSATVSTDSLTAATVLALQDDRHP